MNGSRKRFTAFDKVIFFHHGSVTLFDARGDWLRPGSAGIVARFVVDSWLAEFSAVKNVVVAGLWLLDELVSGETQEEHLRNLILRRSDVDGRLEQVVPQLQEELFTLRAQVAAESGLADAVRAINNLATAQVRKGHSESH